MTGYGGRGLLATVILAAAVSSCGVSTTERSADTRTTDRSGPTYAQVLTPPTKVEGDARSSATASVSTQIPTTTAAVCPAATVTVQDSASLTAALASAGPGDVIGLADGVYAGNFATDRSGSAESPLWVCGGPDAILDGGSIEQGYTLYLKGADHTRLVGFGVRGGQKGVMIDAATDVFVQGLTVSGTGHEAVHLRSATTYSVVRDNDISGTGLANKKFGEGVYVGSASSNWCTYSACDPDRSNNNAIVDNTIHGTSSEAIDIKEGTQNGVIQGNTLDGTDGLTGADSWVDVKGNGWIIRDNHGTDSPVDGFQVHSVLDGWGRGNVFEGNSADVDGSGYGIHLAPVQDNVVTCDNVVTGSAPLTNVDCV